MTSTARTLGPAALSARALRSAGDDASWAGARDALAGALRSEALRVLGIHGVPAQSQEDLAQGVAVTVLDRIVRGLVEPGFEDGYLVVAAKNRARDFHREQSGVYEKTTSVDDAGLVAEGADPHAALERAEAGIRRRALVEAVSRVLDSAPARYRAALVAVYIDGVPIDALVDDELQRGLGEMHVGPANEVGPDEAALARRRARARVDKLLQRARDWVRARVVTLPGQAEWEVER